MSGDFGNYSYPDQSRWTDIKGQDEKKPHEVESELQRVPDEEQPLRLQEEGVASQEPQSFTEKFKSIFSKRERAATSTEQPPQFPHAVTNPPSGKVKSWQKCCCVDDSATQPPLENSVAHFKQLWNSDRGKALIMAHADLTNNREGYTFLCNMDSYRKLCDNKKASSADVAQEYNEIVTSNFPPGNALVEANHTPQQIDINSNISKRELRKKLDNQEAEVLRNFSQSFFKGDTYKNSLGINQ